ncbi:MAG: NAD(+) synthase [Bacteroidetes bacterium]|nr:MAG: NAD(+) synthase [Bacteroidota bacterium]
MKYLRLAGGSVNQTPLDFEQNTRNLLAAIAQARTEQVHILCLPELAISGYGCEDAFFNEYVLRRSLEALAELSAASQGLTVSVGLPMEHENCLYNVVALIHDGEVLGFVPKQELAGDGIYYEPRWFKPWPEGQVSTYHWEGVAYPFGDFIFQIDGVRIGFEICEDAWNGIRPAQRHYLNNVDVILNPSASNFAFGKSQVREILVREASRGYSCTYVYSNLLGNEAGRIIYDGEILIAQSGVLLARNQRFGLIDYDVTHAVVDVERVHIQRKKSFNFTPELPDNLLVCEGSYEEADSRTEGGEIAPTEAKAEEFYLAETLALFDYMRKSRSRGFVLSLSGGADSSACAVLCAHALQRAQAELSPEELQAKLGYSGADLSQPLAAQLLVCVYQGTANSGPDTLNSAQALAEGLGAAFMHWDVEPLHQQYKGMLAGALGRALSWEQDDLALQNIQARLRAPGIWMLANIRNGLLITTSNRSEAAVGYATMDGDTAGGLAPLGGLDKAYLLEWLRWAENSLNIPALNHVNKLQPTAELRPASFTQTDETDLMPYGILDAIEKCAIRDYLSPVETFRRLRGAYPDAQLKAYIRKFFLLWSRNQWKRERYAPSFHLDDANLDPKTWCRFPILNGGFREALAQLDALS